MLAELREQTEFIRTDFPNLRRIFEKYLAGGSKTKTTGTFVRETGEFTWERVDVLRIPQSPVLRVISRRSRKLSEADIEIQISTYDGARVEIKLPSYMTLKKHGADKYLDLPKQLGELAEAIDQKLVH